MTADFSSNLAGGRGEGEGGEGAQYIIYTLQQVKPLQDRLDMTTGNRTGIDITVKMYVPVVPTMFSAILVVNAFDV